MSEIETRRYKITAKKEQLDILEALFYTMEQMGNVGSSRSIQLYVDGDGAFHPKFEKFENGLSSKVTTDLLDKTKPFKERPDSIKHGDGYIQKNCSEWNGDGFYIYYDFG